jgi:hypothetical protein
MVTRIARAAAVLLVVAVAWAMYRPDVSRPFDILDFGEFLPLLKANNGLFDQFTAVMQYNADRSGRANVVPTIAAVLKWRMFGSWTPGWQLAHAVVMLVVMLQVTALIRRCGATWLGAGAAALVFLLAPAAAESWVRLTVGEPLGMIVILGLALRASHFQQTPRWQREVVLFSVGAVLVLLTKELMAPTIVLPLVPALTWQPSGEFARPRASRRNAWLVGAVGAASVATLIPLLLLYTRASSSAFASHYGRNFQSPVLVLVHWITALIPFDLLRAPGTIMWVLAILGFTVLLAAGWRIGTHDQQNGARARWMLTGATLFPLLGVIAYSPWTQYEDRYAFPYLVGTAVLVGMTTSYLQRYSTRGRWWASAAVGVPLLFAAGGAAEYASHADSMQRSFDNIVSIVKETRDIDSVLVVAEARPAGMEWTGLGPSLFRLAAATDRPWPPARDIQCPEARARAGRSPRVAIVIFLSMCGDVKPARRVVTYYRRFDWQRWSLALDSVHADVVSPAETVKAVSVMRSLPAGDRAEWNDRRAQPAGVPAATRRRRVSPAPADFPAANSRGDKAFR